MSDKFKFYYPGTIVNVVSSGKTDYRAVQVAAMYRELGCNVCFTNGSKQNNRSLSQAVRNNKRSVIEKVVWIDSNGNKHYE